MTAFETSPGVFQVIFYKYMTPSESGIGIRESSHPPELNRETLRNNKKSFTKIRKPVVLCTGFLKKIICWNYLINIIFFICEKVPEIRR